MRRLPMLRRSCWARPPASSRRPSASVASPRPWAPGRACPSRSNWPSSGLCMACTRNSSPVALTSRSTSNCRRPPSLRRANSRTRRSVSAVPTDSSRARCSCSRSASRRSCSTACTAGAMRWRWMSQWRIAWRRKRRCSDAGSDRHRAWPCGRNRSIVACHGRPRVAALRTPCRSRRKRSRTPRACRVGTGKSSSTAREGVCGRGSSAWRDSRWMRPRCPVAARVSRASTMLRPVPTMHTCASGAIAATPG